MFRTSIIFVLLVVLGSSARAESPPIGDREWNAKATRGELLYATHCIACHTEQVHWRDKKLATDWASLQAEVSRWQKLSGLRWSDDDVAAVSRYLNALHYRYPTPY